MKTFKVIVAVFLIATCIGCTSGDITISDATSRKKMSAFQDETYVWEQFQYSTNRVNTIMR